MAITEAEKLIQKFEKKLPEIIYDRSEGDSVLWEHTYQRFDIARKMAILSLEQEVKALENIRGEYVTFYWASNSIPVELRSCDLLLNFSIDSFFHNVEAAARIEGALKLREKSESDTEVAFVRIAKQVNRGNALERGNRNKR